MIRSQLILDLYTPTFPKRLLFKESQNDEDSVKGVEDVWAFEIWLLYFFTFFKTFLYSI